MSFEVTTAFVQQYTTNVELLLQQRGSKLRECVSQGNHTGDAAVAVEQIGRTEAQRRVSRHGDTPLISTPHDKRWVDPNDFDWADLIDKQDRLRMLIDPTSPYAVNGAYALGRSLDSEIIRAAFGISRTGYNGGTSTPFDTANQQVAVNHGGDGNTGLTVKKLRAAKKILTANEVDIANDPLYIAVTAQQLDDLLGTTEVTSSDYNVVKALVDGNVDTFMGFKFIQTELLTVDLTGYRRIIAWAKTGLHCGMWGGLFSDIAPRRDKSLSTQVYISSTFGATRVEEGKVVEILCLEP